MVHHDYESRLRDSGILHIAGVDEAGRGPLAGPVVAAAVMFRDVTSIDGVDDSKKLTPSRREELFSKILRCAASVGIGVLSPAEIDELNIYKATMRAMERAVAQCSPLPEHLLIDGPHYLDKSIAHTTIVDGDALCYAIAAASIVAKVTRDRMMAELHDVYPEYGFIKHKGYGTPEHLAAIRKFGPSPVHRKSFRMPQKDGGPDG